MFVPIVETQNVDDYPQDERPERDYRDIEHEVLVEEYRKVLQLKNELLDAIIWMSGSSDFGPGGIAEKGFNKLVRPLIPKAAFIPKEMRGYYE
jgi:hypothetical protein